MDKFYDDVLNPDDIFNPKRCALWEDLCLMSSIRYPKRMTNFGIEQLDIYTTAILEFETKFPEYKGAVYISKEPDDVVDMRGRELDLRKHRALMKASPEPIDLTIFWDIVNSYKSYKAKK